MNSTKEVPLEPTPDMLAAAQALFGDLWLVDIADMWKAMLDAAPQHERLTTKE